MKSALLLSIFAILNFVDVTLSSITLSFGENDNFVDQCDGFDIDFSRLRSLSTNDISTLIGNSGTRQAHEYHTYKRSKVSPIITTNDNDSNQATAPECIGTRHRLQENVEGVPILGADILVTMDNCLTDDNDYYLSLDSYDNDNDFLNVLTEQGASIRSLTGKTFRSVSVPNGYTPTYSANEAMQYISRYLEGDLVEVGVPTLEVFISTGGDFLSYRTYLIANVQGSSNLIEIVVDAHKLSILSRCILSGGESGIRRHRSLRSLSNLQDDDFNCQSCSTNVPKTVWSGDTTECSMNSLYLSQRKTYCTIGKNNDDNSTVFGPGPVSDLNWRGTLDCAGGSTCNAVPFPSCRDALSDIQYAGTTAMQFLRDNLGIKGGLNENINEPVRVKAYAHYQDKYCNAFYNPASDSVYFGDCDCQTWGPLASLDVVGHELFHGVTKHASDLVYSGQSGGLNEAFSDVFGTVLEFLVNDSNDTPDFTIAEQPGTVLRDMENPTQRSIGSVCSFVDGLSVHYSSGVMNKAYVRSARACVASSCGDLRGCAILLGSAFLYSGIHGLTRTSNFLDGAKASCSLVEEFFVVLRPATLCSPNQVKDFIIDGWASVDVNIRHSDCIAVQNCGASTNRPTARPTNPPTQKPSTAAPTEELQRAPTPTDNDGEEDKGCFPWIRNIVSEAFFWV